MRDSKSADRRIFIFLFVFLLAFLLFLLFSLHLFLHLAPTGLPTSSIRRLKTTSITTSYYTRTPPRIHISIRCCRLPEDHSKTTACVLSPLLLSCSTLSTSRASGILSTILSTPSMVWNHSIQSTHILAPTRLSGQIRCRLSTSPAISSTNPCSQNGGEELLTRGTMRMNAPAVVLAPGATQCLGRTRTTPAW